MHDLGDGVGLAVLALALAVGGLALDAGELARGLVEFGGLKVQPFVGRDDAVVPLVGRQGLLGFFEFVAHQLGLLFKKRGVLARWGQLEVEVHVQVGLCKGVRHGSGKVGVGAGIADVDDVAFARRLYLQLSLQQVGQPDNELPLALGFFLPLGLDGGALVHLQQLHHALGHAVAVDDVDLRGHVARGDHALEHHAAYRVG